MGGQLDDIREQQFWRQLRQQPSIDDDSHPLPSYVMVSFFCSSKYHGLCSVMNQVSLQNLFKRRHCWPFVHLNCLYIIFCWQRLLTAAGIRANRSGQNDGTHS
jgi:hypothetical protein